MGFCQTLQENNKSINFVLSSALPVDQFDDPELRNNLKDLYESPESVWVIAASIFNSLVTHKIGAFFMSYSLMNNLIKNDPNVRLESVSEEDYNFFMSRLVYNGSNAFSPIVKKPSRNLWKPIAVKNPEFLTLLTRYVKLEDIDRQVETIKRVYTEKINKNHGQTNSPVNEPTPTNQRPTTRPALGLKIEKYTDDACTMDDSIDHGDEFELILDSVKHKSQDNDSVMFCAARGFDVKSHVLAEKNYDLCVQGKTISTDLLKIPVDSLDWVKFLYSYKINGNVCYTDRITKANMADLKSTLVNETAMFFSELLRETRARSETTDKYFSVEQFISRNGPIVNLPLMNKMIESVFDRSGKFDSLVDSLRVQLATRYTNAILAWVPGAMSLLLSCRIKT